MDYGALFSNSPIIGIVCGLGVALVRLILGASSVITRVLAGRKAAASAKRLPKAPYYTLQRVVDSCCAPARRRVGFSWRLVPAATRAGAGAGPQIASLADTYEGRALASYTRCMVCIP